MYSESERAKVEETFSNFREPKTGLPIGPEAGKVMAGLFLKRLEELNRGERPKETLREARATRWIIERMKAEDLAPDARDARLAELFGELRKERDIIKREAIRARLAEIDSECEEELASVPAGKEKTERFMMLIREKVARRQLELQEEEDVKPDLEKYKRVRHLRVIK